MTEDEWCWLDSQPWIIHLPELDVVAVHGGFMPEDVNPDSYDRDTAGLLTRVGYLSAEGERLSPGQIGPRFWAEDYDGRFGRAVFGHTSFREIRRYPHAIGIDGSKYGQLFAIVVGEGNDLDFKQAFW
jgi:hypothetical protein